jgi:UDP-N-acetylglucosamine 2-epimerase (non-hydrolysing)
MTLRENTERPITVTQGTNRLVKPGELVAMIETVLAGRWPTGQRPERWDGNTADRCVAALRERSANLRAASQQP